jgi:GTP-binding protein EngB required for normal cell division
MVERAEVPLHLQEYERLKFELADVIRWAQLAVSGKDERSGPWPDLMSRLAEDRFTVVVAGRFSRGKSSLMNAVLGFDRLPTGIVPLTSVITYVRYGTSERVLLDYPGTRLRGEAPLEALAEYVTERGNPGNAKRLRSAEIQLPAEILRRGFFFVDTPGLGSGILENTETTERFIPEIDMLILVTGFESPISEDECRFLLQASAAVRAIFVVINKKDTVPPGERQQVVEYVDRRVRDVLGNRPVRIFSVSARDGLAARLASDAERLRESGIHELQTEVVRLLARDWSRLFLSSMCDRVAAEIASLPGDVREGLSRKIDALRNRVRAGTRPEERDILPAPDWPGNAGNAAPRLRGGCEICRTVLDEQFRFLARYQFELSTRPKTRDEHAEHGGFCPLHTWHYEQITSPRAVCTAYPALLHRTASRLRELAAVERDGGVARERWFVPRCPVCRLRWEAEERTVGHVLARIARDDAPDRSPAPALCVPHLRSVLDRAADASIRERLLSVTAAWIERLAEDMQRYAVKHDGLRRALASDEERNAPTRALQVLAGDRNVNAVAPVRDLL